MDMSPTSPQRRSPSYAGLGRSKVALLSVSLLSAAIIFSACQASQATEEDPSPSPPMPSATVAPLPTETPAPTEVPTLTPTSRPPLGPEEPARSIEQIAGRWLMRVMGGGEGDPAIFTLAEDGTHSIDGIGGYHEGMMLGHGTYWFEGDVMYLFSEDCTSPSTTFFTCTATYHVFVAMAEDGPGALRLVAIEDPHPDRRKSLNNKTLYLAPPA